MNRPFRSQQGMTLIELITSIVILSVSLVAIIGVYSNSSANSATPMARIQANFIANAYLEEIMLRAYTDPLTAPLADSGSCEAGETSRALYDDVNDYNCVNDTNGAIDQNGNAVTGLGAYNVDINVTGTTLNGAVAQKIDVIVTRDNLDSINILLSAYRVNYP